MEENKQVEATQEVETTETAQEVKTFTQEEVNELLGKEKSRLKKGMPSKEELEAFNKWKDDQKTESEKQIEREKEYQKTQSEKEYLKQENYLLRKGVKADDVDYIIFKVSKMDGEFEENATNYLQENEKFTQKEQKATGVQTRNTNVETTSGVNAILKAKHPELFN